MNISKELENILSRTLEEAARTGCRTASAGHLMLGILRTSGCGALKVLTEMGIDIPQYRVILDAALSTGLDVRTAPEDVNLDGRGENILGMTILEATMSGFRKAYGIHLLLALLRDADTSVCSYLNGNGVTRQSAEEHMKREGYLAREPRIVSATGAHLKPEYITVFRNPDKPVS